MSTTGGTTCRCSRRPRTDLITLEPPPDRLRRRGGAVFAGVLRAGADATEAEGLYQPVAAGLPGADGDDAGDDSRVRRRLPAGGAAVRRRSGSACSSARTTRASRSIPARVAAALSSAPAVEADLRRLDLGSVREIVGTFVGSAQTLAQATRDSPPVTDDRPMQEYGVMSLLNFGAAVPASVVDLTQVASWCPACFVDGKPRAARGRARHLSCAARSRVYGVAGRSGARAPSRRRDRRASSPAAPISAPSFPNRPICTTLLGIALAEQGELDEAIAEFREALRLEPDSATTQWHLGAALASRGTREEAIEHLRRSVQLDPSNGQAHYDLASVLLEARDLDEAVRAFRATLELMPDSVEAHNNLGLALASRASWTKRSITFSGR